MLKRSRQLIVLLLVFAMVAPVAVFADHKKHFKEGLKYASRQEWDKAAQEFAQAAAEKADNIEYRLHLQKALVNAAVQLVQRGDKLAEQKDFHAAYQAYRQAYSYDQGNELALIKARKMLEALGLPTGDLPTGNDPSGPQLKPSENPNNKANYYPDYNGVMKPAGSAGVVKTNATSVQETAIAKKFPKTQVRFRDINLLTAIEQLSQNMGLNVVFDQQVANQYRAQKLTIDLNDISYPQALELILKTNNLMYAQQNPRTIVIAMDGLQSRMKYEPYAVRTFYVKNGAADEIRTAVTAALQSKSLTTIKQLNAIVARDTPANLGLIESLIDSLDKSKAEVLIDIQIYEVSKNDLLSLGNQFGNPGQNGGIGSTIFGGFGQNGSAPRTANSHIFANLSTLGFALGMPTSAISFFQDKGKAKLLASTQVHILDTEQQTIRIGKRVPIQTASIYSPFQNTPTPGNNQNNNNPNNFNNGLNSAFGGGFPQIQYENVGLNIDMKPQVFENEVQMQMKIESTSIDSSTGTLTPSFNQRTMNSVARVRDGQTTLVAGVSQTEQTKNIKGLPIIGLIPILGRFFSTPDTKDIQSDVVITVTPHILRRADIKEQDHYARAAGNGQEAYSQLSIEMILFQADLLEAQSGQVASNPGNAAPATSQPVMQQQAPAQQNGGAMNVNSPGVVVTPPQQMQPTNPMKPKVKAEPVTKPGLPPGGARDDDDDDDDDSDIVPQNNNNAQSPITVSVRSAASVATRGQDLYVAILLNGNSSIASTNFSMTYDPSILEVKGVRDGGLLRSGGVTPDLQFTADNGVVNVQMSRPAGDHGTPARGQLLLIVFNVKGQGQTPLAINEAQTFIRSGNGQLATLKFQSTQIEVR